MAKRKILKTLSKTLGVLLVLALAAAGVGLYVMARKDREHARFYNTGKSVNAFLGSYSKAFREGFERRDAAAVARLYSDRFASPARGRWVMREDAGESDVSISRLASDGRQDYAKDDINEEVSRYFGTLASVKNIWTKIDMIEQVELERRVVLRVKFILDGTDPQGAVLQDRHFYRWTLANEAAAAGEPGWKIVRDELIEGLRVA